MAIGLGDVVILFAAIFLPLGFAIGRLTGKRRK